MNLQKTLLCLATMATLSSALNADSFANIGITYGSMSTDHQMFVAGDRDNSTGTTPILVYKDMNLIGINIGAVQYIDDSYVMLGFGTDITSNDGSFLEGGTLDVNAKLGGYYKDFSAYGILGYGLQSFSDYTVALGLLYGVGVNYNVFEHISLKAEYRTHSYSVEEGTIFSNPDYTLSGFDVALDFRF